MASRFRFYFDRNPVNEPDEAPESYLTSIKRDYDLNALSTVITTTGLSLSIAANDYIEIKTVTTTLASSHSGYFQSGTIGIQ